MSELAGYGELETVDLGNGSLGLVDLAEWLPQSHCVRRSSESVSALDAVAALGIASGRYRELKIRELHHVRMDASARNCFRGWPESVVINADPGTADAVVVRFLGAIKQARIRCTTLVLRPRAAMDIDACADVVRAAYRTGTYRARVVLSDSDVSDASACKKLFDLIDRELWSILPDLHVTEECATRYVFGNRRWHDLSARVHLREYARKSPEAVWAAAKTTRTEVQALEVPQQVDATSAAIAWLDASYERDLVPSVDVCEPYSTLASALRTPRLFVPACVRATDRQAFLDSEGRLTCCPQFESLEQWDKALHGTRYWDCAMARIEEGTRGCCNGGRLMRRECVGAVTHECPDATCRLGTGLLPVMLRRLFDTLIEPPPKKDPFPSISSDSLGG